MKKKVLSVIVGLSLIFAIPTYSFATDIPTEPIKPEVQTEENVNEYNQKVDEYNQKVDEYNKKVDDTYTEELENYEIKKEEVTEHNNQEEEKVVENQKQLEEQEKTQQKIKDFENKSLENTTKDADSAPTTFKGETENPRTITITKSEEQDESSYKVINIHAYQKENSNYFDNIQLGDTQFELADDILNNLLLLEWETVTANKNDLVSVQSEAKAMGYKSSVFYRFMEGYTKGYWLPTSQFYYNMSNQYDTWGTGGQIINFSYDENNFVENTLILWVYSFIRTAAEPEKVEKYDPDIWEEPTEPTKLDYLNKLSHLTFIPTEEPTEEPTEPVVPEETKPVKPEKEEPTSTPEKTKPIKERTVSQTPARTESQPVRSIITPVMATTTVQVDAEPIEVITNTNVPLANTAEEEGNWALVNLILLLLTIILYVVLSIIVIKKNRRKLLPQLIGVLVAILSLLIFLMTEDMTLPMVLVDQWTIVMFIIFLIEFSLLFIKHKESDKEDEE